jgi:hypothetical protein
MIPVAPFPVPDPNIHAGALERRMEHAARCPDNSALGIAARVPDLKRGSILYSSVR